MSKYFISAIHSHRPRSIEEITTSANSIYTTPADGAAPRGRDARRIIFHATPVAKLSCFELRYERRLISMPITWYKIYDTHKVSKPAAQQYHYISETQMYNI